MLQADLSELSFILFAYILEAPVCPRKGPLVLITIVKIYIHRNKKRIIRLLFSRQLSFCLRIGLTFEHSSFTLALFVVLSEKNSSLTKHATRC